MRLFNKVAIIGMGLMGGSIAKALKKKQLVGEIIGVSRQRKTLLLARKIRAIDRGSQNIHLIKDADLVILATPVGTILNLASEISKIIREDCIVTDVGSAKQEIVAKLSRIFPRYVGSHPLAGSEKQGVVNAAADIFKDSLCIMTPLKNTDKDAQLKIKKLWKQIGAKVVNLTPATHDNILSFVSHLPHIVAFSLISALPRKYLPFAPNGLKDTTRIAASDNKLWCDIFLSNRENMLKSIDLFQENLSHIKSAIEKRDRESLNRILKKAKIKRDNIS